MISGTQGTMTLKEELNLVAKQVAVQNAEAEQAAYVERLKVTKQVADVVGPVLVRTFKAQAAEGRFRYTIDLDNMPEEIAVLIYSKIFDKNALIDYLVQMFPSLTGYTRGINSVEFSWS